MDNVERDSADIEIGPRSFLCLSFGNVHANRIHIYQDQVACELLQDQWSSGCLASAKLSMPESLQKNPKSKACSKTYKIKPNFGIFMET